MTCKANINRSVIMKVLPDHEYIKVSGSTVPSPDLRWCGPEVSDDNFFVKSADRKANRLI